MRRIAILGGVLALTAFVGVAYAVTNTITYTGKMSHKGTPSVKKPAALTYTGTLSVDTNPPGQQPDIAPYTIVYFAKGIKTNGADFASCKQSDIDGQPSIPAKCSKALVGAGTAKAYPGNPGSAKNESAAESLTVKAFNGPKGKQIMLVVNGTSPVLVQNRVIPGTLKSASGKFSYSVQFDIPPDLQKVANVPVSLTDFTVKIPGTLKSVKHKGVKVKESYLAETACKGKLPVKGTTHFVDANGAASDVTSESTSKC